MIEPRPTYRWPNLTTPDPKVYLGPLGVPVPPSQALHGLGSLVQTRATALSPAVLQDVISLLRSPAMELQPIQEPPALGAAQLTPLQAQLLAVDKDLFVRGAEGRTSSPAAAQAPPTAKKRPGAAAAAAAPATADTGRAPPAKKPKLTKIRNVSTRAAVEEAPAAKIKELAETYAAQIEGFVKKYKRILGKNNGDDSEGSAGEEEEEDGEDDGEEDGGPLSARRVAHLLAEVRKLSARTLEVCTGDKNAAVRQVPPAALVALLQVVHTLIETGRDQLLDEDDGDSESHVQRILIALEASVMALNIMTIPNLPQQVYLDEVVEGVLDLARFQLAQNVYPFHSARLRAAARPNLGAAGEDGDEDKPGPSKRKPSAKKAKVAALGIRAPPALGPVLDRTQAVLGLLGKLLPVVRVQVGPLLPLLRAAMISLTVDGLTLLQAKAVVLLASAFQAQPDLRRTLLDELFAHVVPFLGSSRRLPREFVASEDGNTRIQMLTAAVLHMVQVAVDLPAMDCDAANLTQCYAPAVSFADYFWTLSLERLPGARAVKAETDTDFRTLLDAMVRDLLATSTLPEWPAAAALLLRLVTNLSSAKGLEHQDAHVKSACVDLLGALASQLHEDDAGVQQDAEWLQGVAEANGGGDVVDCARQLLLAYLADQRRALNPASISARHFSLSQAFAEELTALQRCGSGEDEAAALLVKYRQQREDLDGVAFRDVGLETQDATRLMRAAIQATLGRARPSLLQWLLNAMVPGLRQGPGTRAKAVKALGDVVAAQEAVLEDAAVQAAVDRALEDDATSVRDAAVGLLGRHISGNPSLALRLFNTLAKASSDPGTSVRKCAIKILWENCIRVPGFPRATDACKHVLMRAADSEESIQELVARVFHGLWFTPRLDAEAGSAAVERSVEERAQQLADVALAVYEAAGPAIHLPLDSNHALVVVLRAALGHGAKGDLKAEWKTGREVSGALIEAVLRAEEDGGDSAAAAFPYLLALHAFAATDVALCMPAKDPSSFVRTLAPYLKAQADAGAAAGAAARRAAEALLCTLSVLDGVLSQLARFDGVEELVQDLAALIGRHAYVQVMASACSCLGTLARLHPVAATQLANLAALHLGMLRQPGQSPGQATRFLFTLGQLCRYGADTMDGTAPSITNFPAARTSNCLQLFLSLCSPLNDLRVREMALQALGLLSISRPDVMVHKGSPASKIMKQALGSGASEAFKLRALSNLTELLKSDAEVLVSRQQEALAAGGKGSKAKKAGAAGVVPTQNGEGDTLSQSGAILQDNWELVLALATDTSQGGGAGRGAAAAGGGPVRRRVMELLEVVLRDGLVAPWTAIPALVALSTEPAPEVRGRALRALCALAEKHPRFMDADRLADGVVLAQGFHCGLARAAGRAAPALGPLLEGLQAVYARVVQDNRPLKINFIKMLLRRFRSACCTTSKGAHSADLRLLLTMAALVAGLPYKRGDEACTAVQEINGVVAGRGEDVQHELARALEAQGGGAAALGPACKASVALSMLLLVKRYLKDTYAINSERIASFASAGDRRKQEERTPISAAPGSTLPLDRLNLGAGQDAAQAREQYKVFKQLMKQDAADYEHLAAAAGRGGGGAAADEDPQRSAGAEGVASPGDEDAATPEWVQTAGAGAATTRKTGRRGGGATGAKTGAKRAATGERSTAGRGGTKRKKAHTTDSDDDGGAGGSDDEEYVPRKTSASDRRLRF